MSSLAQYWVRIVFGTGTKAIAAVTTAGDTGISVLRGLFFFPRSASSSCPIAIVASFALPFQRQSASRY